MIYRTLFLQHPTKVWYRIFTPVRSGWKVSWMNPWLTKSDSCMFPLKPTVPIGYPTQHRQLMWVKYCIGINHATVLKQTQTLTYAAFITTAAFGRGSYHSQHEAVTWPAMRSWIVGWRSTRPVFQLVANALEPIGLLNATTPTDWWVKMSRNVGIRWGGYKRLQTSSARRDVRQCQGANSDML